MKKMSEYRAHAQQCRMLAAKMEQDKDRELLLRMAADWDRLAKDRADLIGRHPELASAGEAPAEPGAGEISGRRR